MGGYLFALKFNLLHSSGRESSILQGMGNASAPRMVVSVEFKIENVDFGKLTDEQHVSLKNAVITTITDEAGVAAANVKVQLTAGSVQVAVSITPPAGSDPVPRYSRSAGTWRSAPSSSGSSSRCPWHDAACDGRRGQRTAVC